MSEPSRPPVVRYPYDAAEAARQGGPAEQLRTLLDLGVVLRPGVDEDVVLEVMRSDDDDAEERFSTEPYRDLLSSLAEDLDPADERRPLATNLVLLDTEFVEDPDAYDDPVRRLAGATGQAHRLTDVESAVDLDEEEGTISYRVDGQPHTRDIEVQGDWADTLVLGYVLDDLLAGTGLDVATFFLGQAYGVLVVPADRRSAAESFLHTWTSDPVLVQEDEEGVGTEQPATVAAAPAAPAPPAPAPHPAAPAPDAPRRDRAEPVDEGPSGAAGPAGASVEHRTPARRAPARNIARVVGIVAVVVGAVWVGQGLGYLPGSFMTGVRFWFWVGLACVLAGLALLFASRRQE